LAIILWVMGCASLSTDPKLVGTYAAENSEALVFMPDSRVFHTQIVDGKEERRFLGYYVSSSNNPCSLGFVAPDTSPFLGTSFEVSLDFSKATARWGTFFGQTNSWQTNYLKTAKPE
jgi:hypothetical protein